MKLLSEIVFALLVAAAAWPGSVAAASSGGGHAAAGSHQAESESAAPDDHGAAHGGEKEGEEAVPKSDPGTMNLGSFELRNYRPTHNDVASVRFSLTLVLTDQAAKDATAMTRLEHWRRRFRDQAIIAVRCATPEDLADPRLARVHLLLLMRLKRLPPAELIKTAYLTSFAVTRD